MTIQYAEGPGGAAPASPSATQPEAPPEAPPRVASPGPDPNMLENGDIATGGLLIPEDVTPLRHAGTGGNRLTGNVVADMRALEEAPPQGIEEMPRISIVDFGPHWRQKTTDGTPVEEGGQLVESRYGLSSNWSGSSLVWLRPGEQQVVGRAAAPGNQLLGLTGHAERRDMSRRQWTVTVPDSGGVVVRDGAADEAGMWRPSKHGSRVMTAPAEPDDTFREPGVHHAPTQPLPRAYYQAETQRSKTAHELAKLAGNQGHTKSENIRYGEGAWFWSTNLRDAHVSLPRQTTVRPGDGEQSAPQDIGGRPGERQTLLGVLDIPGVGPVCIVDMAVAYRTGRLLKRSKLARGMALVKPAGDGQGPHLLGFTQSADHAVYVPNGDNRYAAAMQTHPGSDGRFAVKSFVAGTKLTLIADNYLAQAAIPDPAVWRLPFDLANGSDWQTLRQGVQASGGTNATVRPFR